MTAGGRAGGVCYHDNSKLRASIFTKLGLRSVGEGSDHLQLIKFWPSCAPGKGSAVGRKFLAPPTTASAQCLRLSERFFIDPVLLTLNLKAVAFDTVSRTTIYNCAMFQVIPNSGFRFIVPSLRYPPIYTR